MGTAPELIPQEAEVEVDELDSALEGTGEPGETEGTTEEVVKEEEEEVAETEEPAKAEPEVKVDPREEEIRTLRQILRDQKREMSLLKSKVDRADRKATAGLDEDDEALKEDHSPVEVLVNEINRISGERGAQLELLAETMSETQKYTDIYDVCTKENFSDMFEALGEGIAQQERIPAEQAMLQAEVMVWQMSNPYKYMYNLIKEHHPRFAKAKPVEEVAKPSGKEKTPAKAPASIAGMGGSDTSKSGWTSARIDALPEDELDTVPVDVYSRYLRNELK